MWARGKQLRVLPETSPGEGAVRPMFESRWSILGTGCDCTVLSCSAVVCSHTRGNTRRRVGEKRKSDRKRTAAEMRTRCFLFKAAIISRLARLNKWMGTLLPCGVSEGANLTNKLLSVSQIRLLPPTVAGQKIEAPRENWTNVITSVIESTEIMKQHWQFSLQTATFEIIRRRCIDSLEIHPAGGAASNRVRHVPEDRHRRHWRTSRFAGSDFPLFCTGRAYDWPCWPCCPPRFWRVWARTRWPGYEAPSGREEGGGVSERAGG